MLKMVDRFLKFSILIGLDTLVNWSRASSLLHPAKVSNDRLAAANTGKYALRFIRLLISFSRQAMPDLLQAYPACDSRGKISAQ